jgi:hypothetical protein
MGSLDWWTNLLDNHQADLQILITLRKVTGTITHKVFNTSTLRCCLYEFGEQVCTQSLLFCLVLRLDFYSVGLCSITSALFSLLSLSLMLTTDGQPASLSWSKAPIWGLRPDLYYLCDSYGLVLVGRPLWREVGSALCICCWPLPAQSFSGLSPLGLEIIFYCLST